MTPTIENTRLLSHSPSSVTIESIVKNIADKIQSQGDKAHVTVKYQLELLNQLSQFELGRFILQNRGVNGYWTHYILTYPWRKKEKDTNSSAA